MSEGAIPFLPVHADDIDRYASRLNTLILPDVAVLTPAQEDSIVRFALSGKNLIVTGRSATLDEEGQPKEPGALWKLLGLRLTGQTEGSFDEQPSSWEYPLAHTYLHLMEQRHETLKGFEKTDIIGFGGGIHVTQTNGILKPLCGYVMPFPIYPPEFSWIREINDELHPLFAGVLPGGGRAVYFAADIDRCYGREALPDHQRLLENAIRWAAGESLVFRVESIGHIDVSLYRQENRYIAHLVNLSGCNEMPGYLYRLVPVGPVTVTMPAPERATRVKLLVAEKELPVHAENGLVTFTVDSITDHEVAVAE